jgi:hypothetical protein
MLALQGFSQKRKHEKALNPWVEGLFLFRLAELRSCLNV